MRKTAEDNINMKFRVICQIDGNVERYLAILKHINFKEGVLYSIVVKDLDSNGNKIFKSCFFF